MRGTVSCLVTFITIMISCLIMLSSTKAVCDQSVWFAVFVSVIFSVIHTAIMENVK